LIEIKIELEPREGVSTLEILQKIKQKIEWLMDNHNPEQCLQGFTMAIPDPDSRITWYGEKVIHAAGTFEAKP
jgi:hypothetical protein